MKQLGDDPWQDLARRYPPQTRMFGKVTNIADYGCFVEIEDGVEGLVHVSEMDWTNKNVNPSRVVQIGEEVEVMVIEIDEERRRISLGIKQCKSNPWAEFAATFNRSTRSPVRSSRSRTSVSSSVWTAASTVLCTCPIFPGMIPAKKPCVITRRVRRSRQLYWLSMQNASVFRWASSSLRKIRSPAGLQHIRRTQSLPAR